ncbi:RNA polymerase sigma factor [Caldimonas sp. KR1-144]|uniref:RNA polymerase sigma factor n=1 Tax=Caldimonas sp. KR1-144 TaxID=3400911 RepID=UPI003C0C361D
MDAAADAAVVPDEDAGAEVVLAARIAAAGHGDPDLAAESAFYRRMAPRVRRYGLRHLRDAHAAGDLMQAVMVRTIEQLRAGKLREPQRVVSFVFGMCRLVLLELLRRETRQGAILAQWHETRPAVQAGAEEDIAPRLDRRRVAACLERLAERERSVIVMSFYEERGADEVAAMLGTTAGNVRVIRHRSLARLRDCVTGGTR